MRKGAWLPRSRRWKGNAGPIIEHGVASTRAGRSRKRGTLSAFSCAAVPLVQNVLGVVGAASGSVHKLTEEIRATQQLEKARNAEITEHPFWYARFWTHSPLAIPAFLRGGDHHALETPPSQFEKLSATSYMDTNYTARPNLRSSSAVSVSGIQTPPTASRNTIPNSRENRAKSTKKPKASVVKSKARRLGERF